MSTWEDEVDRAFDEQYRLHPPPEFYPTQDSSIGRDSFGDIIYEDFRYDVLSAAITMICPHCNSGPIWTFPVVKCDNCKTELEDYGEYDSLMEWPESEVLSKK